MSARNTVFSLMIVAFLSACSLSTPSLEATQTEMGDLNTPISTRALPPESTPTITLTPLPTLPPTPEAEIADQTMALQPQFAEDVESFPNATRYWIEVTVDIDPSGEKARLMGLARIRFHNPLDVGLQDLVLMLWPNDSQYQATMTAGPALIDGQLVASEEVLDGLALRMDLPHALPARGSLDISIPFWIEAGKMHRGSPQRFGIAEDVFVAPTFYPLVPRLVDGEWQVEAPPAMGDRTNSDTAFYQVEITAPANLTLVASGTEIERDESEEGTQRVLYVTGPMRDFAFALGDLEMESRKVGDVVLQVWAISEHVDDLDKVLDAAAVQFRLLSELIGPYPYVELDLVDAPGAYGGIEYPGLVFIGTMGSLHVIRPTIHEVAHQWFYGLIGDDQLYEPWLDEAAATYAEALYYEHVVGVGQATGFLTDLRDMLRQHPDPSKPIGLSVAEYGTWGENQLFIYYKGALFFDALRRELGDQVFFEFLQMYFQRYRYGFVGSGDFQTAAEEACGCDLDALFDLWVYQGGELPVP
ncbi:MAG TPA: M1 family metallopeptidase [Anaerolineae bacterium]|nr:M1 family metallopeptidase [Anaerolineae bacterium]